MRFVRSTMCPTLVSTLVAGVLQSAAILAAADEPIHVGGRKQVFIDHRFIASSENVSLKVNPPARRLEAVIKSDKPWDAFNIIWLSAAEDGGAYKMWYQAFDNDQWNGGKCRLCYAVSTDLVHWEKPDLGIVEYGGSRNNNIVLEGVFNGSVFVDPQARPEERYKLIYGSSFVAASADGIRWSLPAYRVAEGAADDVQHIAFWDTRLKKYVVYFRPVRSCPLADPIPSNPPVIAPKQVRQWRTVARLELEDLMKPWPMEKARLVFAADEDDPEESDIYTHDSLQYPYAADAYFAFPQTYQHFRDGETTVTNDGLNDVQFAASRDGIHWMRYDREPYVSRGLPGDPGSGQMHCRCPTLFRRGQYLYQLYGGWPLSHGGFRKLGAQERKQYWGGEHIFLTVQRLDGFVSADAPYDGGWLVTPPMVFQGCRLQLNIDVAAMGEARVEVQDGEGHTIPGYELARCRRILVNETAYTVSWQDKADVSVLAGKPVRLRIWMRSAKLYAFQFVP